MLNVNKVIIAGRLVADPEFKTLQGFDVVTFRLANNRRWRDSANSWREMVCFIDVKAYGRRAEVIHNYLLKGREILVEGHLRLEEWENKEGDKRSKHVIVLDTFHFNDPPRNSEGTAPEFARSDAQGAELSSAPLAASVAPSAVSASPPVPATVASSSPVATAGDAASSMLAPAQPAPVPAPTVASTPNESESATSRSDSKDARQAVGRRSMRPGPLPSREPTLVAAGSD